MAYIGQVVEIPMQGGLTGTKNQASIEPSQLIQALNVSFDTGAMAKEGGASKYNANPITGTPVVLGGCDWWPSDAVQRMVVVLADGTIKKDSGAGTFAVTLASGLTVTAIVPTFTEGGKEVAANDRKLFIFTGKNPVQVLAADGATTAAIATPPADWSAANQPVTGAIHEARLWAAGNLNDPHRVYYSTTTSHEDFTGAGSGTISVFPGEGEKIVGIMSFKGLLLVWKYPKGVYYIDTTDPDVANWKTKVITRGTGGVSPLGQVIIDNDVLYLDAQGNFQLLSATQEFGNMAVNNLSQKYQINTFLRENTSLTRFPFTRAVYYGHKREAHFLFTVLGGSVNNRRMVVDFNAEVPRFRFSDRDVNECIWMRQDTDSIQHPVIGDNLGSIWLLDQAHHNKDGLGYSGLFQTAQLDFSHVDLKLGIKRKNGQFLELVAEPIGNWNLAVEIQWDGITTQTVQFNMGSSGAAIGSFVLGIDALGNDTLINRKRRITGGGRRFSLVARNAGADEDFSISRFFLHFALGDERL